MRPLVLFLTLLSLFTQVSAQNAKQFMKAGNEFMKTGNYADAAVQFTKALELAPNTSDAYIARAGAYEQLEKFQDAASDYIRAAAFLPRDPVISFKSGQMFYLLGDYDKSLEWLNKSLAVRRDYMEALQHKILVLSRKGNFSDALAVCDAALGNKENSYNLYLTGMVLENLGDLNKAEEEYKLSIYKDKSFIDPRIALAGLRLKLNKPSEALTDINAALALDQNNIEAYLTRSRVYAKMLDYPGAINDVSKTILISPNDETLYLARGILYQEFTQHQNAINDFNKVLLINGKNAEALYRRASSNEEIANYKGAIRDYESLVNLSEYDARAKKLLDEAHGRLFELNRESVKPELRIINPGVSADGIIELPKNKTEFSLIAQVSDQSEITSIQVNGKNLPGPFTKTDNHYEFITGVNLDTANSFSVQVSDIYNNTSQKDFLIRRTEINPPRISLVAPYSSDDNVIYLDRDQESIYIQGNISDESPIKSILINGVSAGGYAQDEVNPGFNVANLNIVNKSQITITATDVHGNVQESVFNINREGAELNAENPMGKTWVVFIENSKYQVFASLEGPSKDVTIMRTALAKYSINNIIHKKDLSKKEMERFFAIELRDILRSNHVNSLLIWYSGHGKFINETGYWIPVDAARDDEFTYFNINAMRAAMQSYTGLIHTLVVTDACESGPTFYQAMRSVPEIRSCNDWNATKSKSSQVFSSAGYELAIDNSQFTKTFASTLANNPDACIPIELIVNKVTQAVGQNNQQRPQFGKIAGLNDENGTFFFIVKDPAK
jgi:tetratricopeptide (TPR) repeat protein